MNEISREFARSGRRGSKSDTAQVRWVMLKPKGSIDARQYAAAFVTQCTLSLNDGD